MLIKEVYAFLDSVAPLYPAGVPKRCLQREASAAAASSAGTGLPTAVGVESAAIAFVGCWDLPPTDADVFKGEEGALLFAAIERGLKTASSEVGVLRLAPDASVMERKQALSLTASTWPQLKALVVLGAHGGAFLPEEEFDAFKRNNHGITLLPTFSLSAIVKDESAKRAFWKVLKSAAAAAHQ